jgi:hypothetical protein
LTSSTIRTGVGEGVATPCAPAREAPAPAATTTIAAMIRGLKQRPEAPILEGTMLDIDKTIK